MNGPPECSLSLTEDDEIILRGFRLFATTFWRRNGDLTIEWKIFFRRDGLMTAATIRRWDEALIR
jgi:hypothetical protein